MLVPYVHLVESADRAFFESELLTWVRALRDDRHVHAESIQVSLAIGPGPHFGALVSWTRIEVPPLPRLLTGEELSS